MLTSSAVSGPVCLVRPPAVESFRFVTSGITLPLGLAYIAGAIEGCGRAVHVIDAVGEAPRRATRYYKGFLVGLPLEEIVARVPAESSLVGISVVFTHEYPAVVRLVELLKKARPELRVVLGGEHVTAMPEFCLATSKADFVVCGEGEETIVELLEALDLQRPLDEVAGIGFRDGPRLTVNPRRTRNRDIDAIPYPAWHHFAYQTYSDHHYIAAMDTQRLNLPLLATRGCPYQCTFCSSPNTWQPQWIPRDPVKVVDEIEHHVRTYGASSFPFQDLTAVIRRDWIVAFCEEVLRRGLDIRWQMPSGTRAEAVDAEVADLMKRSGMVSLAYAPESGSEETRKLIKKRMTTEDLLAGIRASSAAGLNVAVFTVIGFPHDTPASLAHNLEFVRRVRALGVTDLAVGYYFALPATELFDSLYDAGRIRLDATYFGHILQGGDLVPSVSHCESLGRLGLMRWKFQMYATFYSARDETKPRTGLAASLWRAFSGLFASSHDSKLQTVFRNAMYAGWTELRLALTRGWLSRSEERALFSTWDDTFRAIRAKLIARNIAVPAHPDTSRIHQGNVMKQLRVSHQTPRTLRLDSAAS
ncbi:MAG: B12-binding domain-containing radical SAM protein [Deltaproteobacteria bacterium]|nr:B12-binding domain-containing radical SAM protein [Deltaproteobacteria bacterium]